MSNSFSAGGVDNLLLATDSAKVTHHLQYPPNVTVVCLDFESRGGKFEKTVFFGLQYILKRWLVGPVVTDEKIAEAKAVFHEHFGRDLFNEAGWKYIVDHHDGRLPIRIKAVPEGLLVPCRSVLFTVENTDPLCAWLPSYLEAILFQVWFPTTVATNSFHQRQILSRYLLETTGDLQSLPCHVIDFGFREASSVESAAIGGLSHLISFRATETVAALMAARKYYHCHQPCKGSCAYASSDHSSMTIWGRELESEAYRNMLKKFPQGVVTVVSDGYDIHRACAELWGAQLMNDVIHRGEGGGGEVFIRSDSGQLPDIIVELLEILGDRYGTELTSKGFRRLASKVRVLHSNWVCHDTLEPVLSRMKDCGWSADNVAFGNDGELVQYVDSDDQQCHLECSHVIAGTSVVKVDGRAVTSGLNGRSSQGHLLPTKQEGESHIENTENCCKGTLIMQEDQLLLTVFEDGKLIRDFSLDEVRAMSERGIVANSHNLNELGESKVIGDSNTMALGLPSGGIDNIILCADSYKVTHHLQYPPDTSVVYSYFESRGGKFEKTVFFGLQYILKRWLVGPVVTDEKIAEAKAVFQEHFGRDLFNEAGWKYIVDKHNGHLPLRIKAVAEGTVVPVKNVLFTIENTDPECFWLTNYVETILVQVWYPVTVATNSFYQKKVLAKYLIETADNMDSLRYQLHDFGYRGVSSVESAGIGGAGHLVNFYGTDTLAAIMTARKYYGEQMAANSIPAAEHSTITTWGKDREKEAFQNMMDRIPDGAISIVSDSYNIWDACDKIWGKALKDAVIERGQRGGRIVIRPDSGKPEEIVVKVLDVLGKHFPTQKNTKGYRLLPPYLRIIQGDGISYDTLPTILAKMKKSGWSTDNIVFGSGGALLQRLDRDTQKFALKCSFAVIDGKPVNVYKEPVTDMGKKSKRGCLRLFRQGDCYSTKEECVYTQEDDPKDQLVTVFENGRLIKDFSFEEIRKLANLEILAMSPNKL